MKKALIAGAASVALAAMPMTGVFATGTVYGSPIVDTLTMNLTEVCTLSRKVTSNNGGHPAGEGTNIPAGAAWTPGAVVDDGEDADTDHATIAGVSVAVGSLQDTFTADIIAGTTYNNVAASDFNVTCNDVKGAYNVTVATSDFANDWQYNANGLSTANLAANGQPVSSWTLSSTGASTITSGIVWNTAAKGANDNPFDTADFTISYSLRTNVLQAAGSYTANAVYTLNSL